MVTIAHIVAALLVRCMALLVVHGLVGGGIADPALLIVHGGTVLPVPGLVDRLTLGVVAGLASCFNVSLERRVVDGFTLPVADGAATFLKEGVVDGRVDGFVSRAALWLVSVSTIPGR